MSHEMLTLQGNLLNGHEAICVWAVIENWSVDEESGHNTLGPSFIFSLPRHLAVMVLFCNGPLLLNRQPVQALIDSGYILRMLPNRLVE